MEHLDALIERDVAICRDCLPPALVSHLPFTGVRPDLRLTGVHTEPTQGPCTVGLRCPTRDVRRVVDAHSRMVWSQPGRSKIHETAAGEWQPPRRGGWSTTGR